MNWSLALLIFLSGLFGGYSLLPRKFYYVLDAKTWDLAQSYCRLKYNDLVLVSSEDDLDTLKALLPAHLNNVWIGGFDLNSDSNTTVSVNTTTSTPESNKNCIGLDTNSWKQTNMPCLAASTFCCSQYEGKRVLMQMKLTPDGNMDMSDPVLQANILAKINEKFNTLGFGDAVQIRWFTKQETPAKTKQNNACS